MPVGFFYLEYWSIEDYNVRIWDVRCGIAECFRMNWPAFLTNLKSSISHALRLSPLFNLQSAIYNLKLPLLQPLQVTLGLHSNV